MGKVRRNSGSGQRFLATRNQPARQKVSRLQHPWSGDLHRQWPALHVAAVPTIRSRSERLRMPVKRQLEEIPVLPQGRILPGWDRCLMRNLTAPHQALYSACYAKGSKAHHGIPFNSPPPARTARRCASGPPHSLAGGPRRWGTSRRRRATDTPCGWTCGARSSRRPADTGQYCVTFLPCDCAPPSINIAARSCSRAPAPAAAARPGASAALPRPATPRPPARHRRKS